jgi:hypothetical protein
MVAVMAKRPKKMSDKDIAGDKDKRTTISISTEDAVLLQQLASIEKVSILELFRRRFRDELEESLAEAMTTRANELKNKKKD